MGSVTANDLKTRGISAIEERVEAGEDVVVSVRGQDRFVVMSLERYDELRESELDRALAEARADHAAGRVVTESVDEHLKRHPELQNQYRKTLQLLELDPTHPSLRLHRLGGRLSELYSVSINLRYRITIDFLVNGDEILLVNVGSHNQAYRDS